MFIGLYDLSTGLFSRIISQMITEYSMGRPIRTRAVFGKQPLSTLASFFSFFEMGKARTDIGQAHTISVKAVVAV